MSKIVVIEVLIFVVAMVFGLRWIANPEGQFEPIIVFCTILFTGIDLVRRGVEGSSQSPPVLQAEKADDMQSTTSVVVDDGELPRFPAANSCAFFAQRFSQAFPGIRKGQWFDGYQAIERLSILLAHPLKYSLPNNGWISPIGWQRDGNMTFDDYKTIKKDTVIIDSKELKVTRIYAGYMSNYKQLFVYLEADKMPATGLYENSQESFKETLEYFGYVWEEYGLYKGIHPVTRAEYDDNAAIIMGKPVNLKGDCEIRTRYLTCYNMIISASSSSINQSLFDQKLKKFMNRMLSEDCMEEFLNAVELLPSARGY